MMKITVYGRMYGTLVMAGKRAISKDQNPDDLPIVPEKYQEEALAYIEYVATSVES